jgi:hypothetical protein
MKKYILYTLLLASFCIIAGCEYDNYDAPTSSISGMVHYNGTPVGVRSNGTNLELYQHGYALFQKVNVYISQEGTYSVRLFDGDYIITRLTGAPWEASSDSVRITVKGNTICDIPVVPYFTINSPTFTYSGGTVTATCNVTKVTTDATKSIQELKLYVGTKEILDNNYNSILSKTTSSVSLTAASTLSVPLNSTLSARQYVYVRLGVQISGIQERFYSPSVKLMLQ